jgi:hypothetical protein
MRALKILVVVMGVLIVGGVAVLVAVLAQRLGGGATASPPLALEEPAGSRIVGTSLSGERLAVQVQGGGADRVLIIDTRTGRVTGRVALTP